MGDRWLQFQLLLYSPEPEQKDSAQRKVWVHVRTRDSDLKTGR